MEKLSFTSFLNSDTVYDLNRKFWIDIIKKAQPDSTEWMKNEYNNGVIIRDGNPLVSFKYKEIALRIIQSDIDSTIPKLIIWEKNHEEFKITELIIHLQPYNEVYIDTIKLIQLFFKNRYKRTQASLNRKYYIDFSKKRKTYMIQVLKRLSNEDSPLIIDKRIAPSKAKIIKAATRKLPILKASKNNLKMVREYNKTAKTLFYLYDLSQKDLSKYQISKVKDEIEEIKDTLEEISKD